MSVQITTRQIELLPEVIWISSDPTWQRLLESEKKSLFKSKFNLRFLSPLVMNDEDLSVALLESSYKVVLAFTPQELIEYEPILENLYPRLKKTAVTVLLPWAQALEGSGVPESWQQYFHLQQQQLENLVGLLPNARVVLVEELLLRQEIWRFPSTLVLSLLKISKENHRVVTNLVSPLDALSLVNWLPDLLGQPHKPQTTTVRARKEKTAAAQQKLVHLYEKMFSTAVEKKSAVAAAAIRPNWVSKQQVLDSPALEELTTDICQQLPPPSQSHSTFRPSWLPTPPPPAPPPPPPPPTPLSSTKKSTQDGSQVVLKSDQNQAKQVKPTQPKEISADIDKLFQSERNKEKSQGLNDLAEQELIFRHKRRRRQRLFYGGVVFIGVGMGILTLMIGFALSRRQLEKHLYQALTQISNQQEVETDDWQKLLKEANRLGWQAESYAAVVDSDIFTQALQLQQIVSTLNEAQQTASQSSQAAQNLALSMLNNNGASVEDSAQTAQITSQETYQSMARAQAQAENSPLIIDSPDLGEKFIDFLVEKQQKLVIWQRALPIVQSLAAKTSPQRYLLVFQNQQELRPTGGFIQAVALITLDRGRLIDAQTYSSYQIDDLLPGLVAPPDEIGRYLNEKNWYFRDANWDPYLPASATRINWFASKALNTQFDGTIFLTNEGLALLLDSLNPIELPAFNEVITADNLNERLEFHSTVQLDNKNSGSDYSALLLKEFFNQIQAIELSKLPQFGNKLLAAIQESEMQFYSTDQSIQSTLSTLTWTGELFSPSCPSQFTTADCQVDTIAQVEANVGVNKANAYLRRQISHQIEITPDKVNHTRTITFENTARTASWPKGPYQAYMRFYLPNNAQFREVRWGQQKLDGDQIRLYREHDRLILGVPISLDVGKSNQLTLSFSTPHKIAAQSAYLLFDQKQSGRGQTDYRLTMSYPSELVPRLIAPNAESFNQELVFSPDSTRHVFAGVQF